MDGGDERRGGMEKLSEEEEDEEEEWTKGRQIRMRGNETWGTGLKEEMMKCRRIS